MASTRNELEKALRENFQVRRELAAQVADVKGDRLAPVRFRLARAFGALRYALLARRSRASLSAAVLELMTLEGAREQYIAQLQQLDRQALLKEIEQLRSVLADLPSPRPNASPSTSAIDESQNQQE
jgi:hypothetical protein